MSIKSALMTELRRELGESDSFVKSSFVLGSEGWEDHSTGQLTTTLCLVHGRKGRLGYSAKTPAFTSLILRMSLGI